jgi:hypothetical protein
LRRRRPGVGAGVATVLIESARSEKLREDDRCHPPSFQANLQALLHQAL